MKLNPKTIEILVPQRLNLVATNKLSIGKKTLSVSSSLVSKMGCPEYARFYIDRSAKQLFIVPCKSNVEGARKFFRQNSKMKTVGFSSTALIKTIAKVARIDLDKKNRYRFSCEEVEGRENALGFDLNK
ncbi:hypothetical protein QQG09_08955, partial [Melissococcus plutonius]